MQEGSHYVKYWTKTFYHSVLTPIAT